MNINNLMPIEISSITVAHNNAVRLLKEMEDRRKPWMLFEDSKILAEFKRNHPANRL